MEKVWQSSFCARMLEEYTGDLIVDLFIFLFKKLKKEGFEVFAVILWFVWKDRNNIIYGNRG